MWKNIIAFGSNRFVQGIILICIGIIGMSWTINVDRWCPEGWNCTKGVTPWRSFIFGVLIALGGIWRLLVSSVVLGGVRKLVIAAFFLILIVLMVSGLVIGFMETYKRFF